MWQRILQGWKLRHTNRGQGVTGQYLLGAGLRGPGLPARGHEALPAPGGSTEQPRTWPWKGQTGPCPGRAQVPWTGAPEAAWGQLDTQPLGQKVSKLPALSGARGFRNCPPGPLPCFPVCTSGCWSHSLPVCTSGCWIHCSLVTLELNLFQHYPTKLSEDGSQTPLTTSSTWSSVPGPSEVSSTNPTASAGPGYHWKEFPSFQIWRVEALGLH